MWIAYFLIGAAILSAADRTFLLETNNWTPYTRTYLGNGLIGLSSSQLGTAAAESYMAGVYDHAPADIPRLALLPAWNEVDFYDGRAWLNRTNLVRAYRQTLNMYDGTLQTLYDWVDGDYVTGVRVESFVSRSEANLGVVLVEITPRFSGKVRVRLPLHEWPPPKRYPLEQLTKLEGEAARNQQVIWYPGHIAARKIAARRESQSGFLQMVSQPEGTKTQIAQTVVVDWPHDLESAQIAAQQTNDACAIEISFTARAGQTYTFRKYAAIVSSDDPVAPIGVATEEAKSAQRRGYQAVLASHADAWHRLWQADIEVNGDAELQTVVHSMLFYLLGSAREDSPWSIPPMGLSTAGYYGHIFWDADTFLFPVLMALHPEMAKPLIMFRCRTLEAAQLNAKRNARQGAMYPWEAGPDGAETTPRFAYQNALYENHVNGDVALAQWQYFQATGDRKWLEQFGYPVIRATADFWLSRVNFNQAKDRYEISGVVSVDESKIGVSDDPYTNAAAKKNLELANEAAQVLGLSANPKWAEIARKLYLPRKDVLLLDYPLGFPLTEREKRAIFETARKRLSGRQEGVMMEVEFNPILAVELGEQAALRPMLENTYRPYLRPPFNVLPETPANDNINFITGAGAFLQQFIFGYAGMRFSTDMGLSQKIAPMLPVGVNRLLLRNLSIRGRRVDIAVPSSPN